MLHPLATLGRFNEQVDRRLVRRPLAEAELRDLIDRTRPAPAWRGMPAPDHVMFYLLAAPTGLRRSELASLTPRSFRLDGNVPLVEVEPAYTKNGKLAEQPLPGPLVEDLRGWLAGRDPGRPAFDPLSEKTGQMLEAELRRCGIDPVDSAGRVVDMHSLRHGYVTMLARAGVPVKTLRTLARHSDPRLTLNVYSHLTAFDTAGPCPT